MVNRSLLYLYLKISSMWLQEENTMVLALPAMYMCPNICILALYCPQDCNKRTNSSKEKLEPQSPWPHFLHLISLNFPSCTEYIDVIPKVAHVTKWECELDKWMVWSICQVPSGLVLTSVAKPWEDPFWHVNIKPFPVHFGNPFTQKVNGFLYVDVRTVVHR